MDTRGHGRSGWDPRAPLSYDQMAGDAIAVLDAAHATKVAVVGVSDGGIVGLLLAIHKSERVRALLAWGANFNTDDEPQGPPDPAFKTMGHDFMAQREAEYRRLSPTPDGFPQLRQALNTLYDHEPNIPPEDLKRITAPTIIADGDHEQFISRAHTQKLAALIPGGRLVILPNVSHGGFEQDPEGFHQIVAGLLGDR
jgi:pimeloyl-ACP methyl ester carboxylesterase